MVKKPHVLIVRDGWGFNPDTKHNAVYHAKTPNHDHYVLDYPTSLIVASGESVGLPPSNQGSSEVGHLNMGAGRVVHQSLVRISNLIEEGAFFSNHTLRDAFQKAKDEGSAVHLWGLVQDQGVHAHSDHLIACLKLAAEMKLPADKVLVHVFTDGRDTPPKSSKRYIKVVEEAMSELGVGVFASVTGRYYSMDRDTRWERIKLAYDMLVGDGHSGKFSTVYEAVEDGYDNGETDEFIKPRVLEDFHPVSENDVVVFFNYRLDRTRELTRAFVEDGFSEFPVKNIRNLTYICFTEYYEGVQKSSRADVSIVFPPSRLDNLFGQFLADRGMKQLRIAETEKFAHVTFFFNGQSDIVFDGEDRVLIPSPQVATYDLQPEMSAYEVRDKAVEAIRSGKYDVVILNFANPDMVGHTGVFEAARKACEVVDECVGDVTSAVLEMDGVALITADHGNAEQMLDYESGKAMTAHTNNLVWFSLVSKREDLQRGRVCIKPGSGRLADVIPTLIDILGLEKPAEMEGESLLLRVRQQGGGRSSAGPASSPARKAAGSRTHLGPSTSRPRCRSRHSTRKRQSPRAR